MQPQQGLGLQCTCDRNKSVQSLSKEDEEGEELQTLTWEPHIFMIAAVAFWLHSLISELN